MQMCKAPFLLRLSECMDQWSESASVKSKWRLCRGDLAVWASGQCDHAWCQCPVPHCHQFAPDPVTVSVLTCYLSAFCCHSARRLLQGNNSIFSKFLVTTQHFKLLSGDCAVFSTEILYIGECNSLNLQHSKDIMRLITHSQFSLPDSSYVYINRNRMINKIGRK